MWEARRTGVVWCGVVAAAYVGGVGVVVGGVGAVVYWCGVVWWCMCAV